MLAKRLTEVTDCARCGRDHPIVVLQPLTRPVVAGNRKFTAWAACPHNGQPIMVEVVNRKKGR